MTPKLIHIGIEQILQNINSNVYNDFLPKEIDLQFNTVCDKFIDYVISNKVDDGDRKLFEGIQFTADDLRLLKIIDVVLIPSNNIISLPSNYRNLINDRSLVLRTDCGKKIKSGEIESNQYYVNKLDSPLVYNNQTYNVGEIFVGLENNVNFSISQSPYTGNVFELIESENRLIESENSKNYLKSSFTKTKFDSPVSEIYQNSLKLYNDKSFKIYSCIIDYIRKLNNLNSANWEVDWNTEFPDNVIKTLIDLTAKRLIFIVESNKYQVSQIELAK